MVMNFAIAPSATLPLTLKKKNNNITIVGLVGKEMNHGKQQKNSGTEISLHKSSYTDPYCYLVAHHAVYYLIFIHSL